MMRGNGHSDDYKAGITGISRWGLRFIRKLRPASWNWKPPLSDGRKHFGFIAQDVNTIAPSDDYGFVTFKEGYMGLHYNEFIGPMAKAIQELDEQRQEDKKTIDDLLSRLEKLEENKKDG